MAWTTAGSRSGMGGYELHDQLSEPFFRLAGGYVANFSSSVDSNSEEIYSRQVLYSSYTSNMTGINSPYEKPLRPNCTVKFNTLDLEAIVKLLEASL